MTSSTARLRGLARAYSNLARGLADGDQARPKDASWEDGLGAALQVLDMRKADVLADALDASASGRRVAALADLGIEFPEWDRGHTGLAPSMYARHAGVDPHLVLHVGDDHIAVQTEVAACLAWAEATRHTGHHPVEAAGACQWRWELLRTRLVPTLRQELGASNGLMTGLLTVLAWVAWRDLQQRVRP